MSRRPVVSVRDLGVAYEMPHHQVSSLKERLVIAARREARHERKWGLRGVSFEIAPSEILGVIGRNGAGKSTLMKTLARVLPPTEGRVIVRGRVAPLIELGAGFNTDLTGRENIVLYGSMLGYSPADMRREAPAIADWAGLEAELDVPVRTYSSGMLMRLAFATATAITPQLLLVDEALSVGDEGFRTRSWERIRGMIEQGTAVVLVSHELETIESLCHEAIWIEAGHVRAQGQPADVVTAYKHSFWLEQQQAALEAAPDTSDLTSTPRTQTST